MPPAKRIPKWAQQFFDDRNTQVEFPETPVNGCYEHKRNYSCGLIYKDEG